MWGMNVREHLTKTEYDTEPRFASVRPKRCGVIAVGLKYGKVLIVLYTTHAYHRGLGNQYTLYQ